MSQAEKDNIVDGFRVLRKFCNDVSLMLKTANGMMQEAGWARISKRTPAVDISGDLDDPDCWLPDAFFCFYDNAKVQHLLPFIAVHVDDLYGEDPSLVTQTLISAGWVDYGVGSNAVKEWDKDYSVSYSHLWMTDRVDDGTLHSGDAHDVWDDEDTPAGTVKLSTFAYPLCEITSSKPLKDKIVQRLLDEINKACMTPS